MARLLRTQGAVSPKTAMRTPGGVLARASSTSARTASLTRTASAPSSFWIRKTIARSPSTRAVVRARSKPSCTSARSRTRTDPPSGLGRTTTSPIASAEEVSAIPRTSRLRRPPSMMPAGTLLPRGASAAATLVSGSPNAASRSGSTST